ncbi:PAP/25A-associated [Macleaya cordata]|uniref:polynucleotide adenylyltransferase n=1 Tax=Macleaya cordata TaxID=56857 RepID=A0A200QWT8_MACCD|nr:PAP/25A-associated [Macleaya cordata]
MEVAGFLYETLGNLSASTITSTDSYNSEPPPESYSVFRNQISSTSPNCPSPSTTAQDYFSLDVNSDDEDDVSASRKPSNASPSPSTVSTPIPSTNPTLERGWFRANSRFKSPMIQLHKEILDFCDFLSPTPEEQASRNTAVDSVFDVIKYIWPHCNVEVFGSFKTGLYLPTSDIDVVILDSKVRTPQIGLQALSRALSQRGIAKKIQVIAKARVPIIKFIERQSGVAFDISFDVENGPKAAEFIKDAINKIPPLRPLCLILKVFLQQRELNEVYSGGIGSYTLLSMLIAQLQMHWKGQYFQGYRTSLEHNLGVLLVNFFDIYGRKLNTWDVGVSCKDSGTFFLKTNKGFLNEDRPYLLCIEDPQAPENDIGRNSFNFSQIRSAFGMAFSMLTSAKSILGLGPNRSILGTIIRPDPLLLERKGGSNGDVTFNSLLPGAGEPVESQFQPEQDILCNWQLDDDEPLPRGNGTPGDVSLNSSRKRKSSSKEKKSKAKENGEVKKSHGEENGIKKNKGSKKKHWRDYQDADDGHGGSSSNYYANNGSPWSWTR